VCYGVHEPCRSRGRNATSIDGGPGSVIVVLAPSTSPRAEKMLPYGGTPVCPRCTKSVYAAEQVCLCADKMVSKALTRCR
jgi:hypothetical protein